MELKPQEARFLHEVVSSFAQRFERDVVEVLARELRNVEPASVRDLREQLNLLLRQLEVRQEPLRVHEVMTSLVKHALVCERRRLAEELERPLSKVSDPAVAGTLSRDLRRLDAFLASEAMVGVEPRRVPRLTDFLSIRFAAEARPTAPALAPRVYDEKFHILEAPQLFLPDLAYYRDACGLRSAPLSVAFLDIDDFKAVNAKLGETTTDHAILAPFMELVEAWSFGRGHSYRFGGDEYVALLPNATAALSVELLCDLRQRLARATYRGTKLRVTVSIGVAVVDPDCHLTDREILARANEAKTRAMSVQKGSIVVVEGPGWDVGAGVIA